MSSNQLIMIRVWWKSRRENRNVSNEMLPDCNDRSLNLWADGVTDGEAASLLTWAQFLPTSWPEMLERNKLDWWAISTPTCASFLQWLSSTYPLQKTLQCSRTASMTVQWRGSYLHFLIWTSLVLLYFKYLLPLRCQIPLSLIYILKPNTCSKEMY